MTKSQLNLFLKNMNKDVEFEDWEEKLIEIKYEIEL